MKSKLFGALTALLVASGSAAVAREPGIGNIVPSGATLGVPIGANPPPGFFFSSRTTFSFGELKDANGDRSPLDVDLNVKATVLQLHYTPGVTILGGDYRFMALLPVVNLDQKSSILGNASGTEIGDLTISPFNLSWMVEPGIFLTFGTSINVPTGKFDPNGLSYGINSWGGTLEFGYSYLRDGWNASVHVVYSTQGTNKTTNYKSGDEVLVNVTAMKNMGDFSIGPIGYWRKQIEDDVNNGAFYGGGASGRAEQIGLGIGYARPLAGGELNVNLMHDVMAKNTVGGTSLQVNFSIPLGAKAN